MRCCAVGVGVRGGAESELWNDGLAPSLLKPLQRKLESELKCGSVA